MEETGENWPLDSDLDMDENNNLCFDGEELPCDYDDDEITDRERRELEERLLALSATIPGLKNKMDDTLILDKASNYVKQLQQRVRELEQQQEEVCVESHTTNINNNDNNFSNKLLLGSTSSSSCEEEVNSHQDHDYYYGHNNNNKKKSNNLPEVKAKVMQKQVLVIVHCEKQKGIMIKILSHLQNLHLSVLNSSVLPFGKSTLDITIVAHMEDGYNMTVAELVKSLRLAILTH